MSSRNSLNETNPNACASERKDANSLEDSLFVLLENAEVELKQALSENNLEEATKIQAEVSKLTKEINKTLGEFHLDAALQKPPTKYSLLFKNYRDPHEITNSPTGTIPKTRTTSIIAPKISSKVFLQPPRLNLITEEKGIEKEIEKDETIATPQSFSTPLSSKKEVNEEIIQTTGTEGRYPLLTPENAIETVTHLLSRDVKRELIESYFSSEKNVRDLTRTVKKETNFLRVLELVKERLNTFVEEKGDSVINNQTCDEFVSAREEQNSLTQVASACINRPHQVTATNHRSILAGHLNRNNNEMNNTMHIRGLSLKDALDLIPRYNGQNISLTQFLDGCAEAKNILPAEYEKELARLIRMRLSGEALNSARGQNFNNIIEISDFFESIFGSSKTYFDWTGELAKVKQKTNESVIVYLNRIVEIRKEIEKAARREKRNGLGSIFQTELEADCVKFFLRGLRWEIRARMGTPTTLKNAREQALDIEREFACSVLETEPHPKDESKFRTSRDTKRVNYVENERATVVCQYCSKNGHSAVDCFSLARDMRNGERQINKYENQNRVPFYSNRNTDMRNSPNYNTNFGGWNSENRRRTEFLPNNEYNRRNYNQSNFQNYRNYEQNSGPRYSSRNDYSGNNNTGYNEKDRRPPPNSSRNQPNNPSNIPSCFYCGRLGHVQRDCFKFKRETQAKPVPQGNSQALSSNGATRETAVRPRPSPPTGESRTMQVQQP